MAKRKREAFNGAGVAKALKSRKEATASVSGKAVSERKEVAITTRSKPAPVTSLPQPTDPEPGTTTIQIITGSYERVLHGFTATVPHSIITRQDVSTPESEKTRVDFSDTFLFNAHASSIRCLALSPISEEASKVMLATGGTDERINLFSLSTAPPVISKSQPKLPSLHSASITENPKNKELGSLLHHSSNITALYFPTRSKLLSAAEDSTIAITRTRDWTASTIKAPIPKPQGRPSGDTAGPGEVPSGINDFAVHPSMKLMVSVGKGEKCMRLWNLVTGKKAGVLNFGRDVLAAGGESRFGSGEGHRVIWDKEGEEFTVAFERGAVVFSIDDSKPKAKIVPTPRTKLHQMKYLQSQAHSTTILVATEDGRVLLYDTNSTSSANKDAGSLKDDIPSSRLIAQIGGPGAGIIGRVKDFEIIPLSATDSLSFFIITGSSDGTVRTWYFDVKELESDADIKPAKGFSAKQVGKLLGTYTTGTRITCLTAFAMTGKPDAEEDIIEQHDDQSSSDEVSE